MMTKGSVCDKSSKPLITIITVCKNSASTIRQSIESVLSQDYSNIEYLVLDGASTDGTLDILKEYNQAHPSRLHFISESDSGLYFAMNRGIEMANGELIGIINSDDVYRRQALSEVVNLWLDKNRPELILGSTAIMDDSFSSIKGIAKPIIERVNRARVAIPHPSSFISKGAYSRYGKFDTRFRYAADRELFMRFIFSGANYVIVDSVFAYFRQGGFGSRIGVTAQIENYIIDKKFVGTFAAYKNFFYNYLYSLYKKIMVIISTGTRN
jgi:glycosyltransferase involved in cell wall biosynthesis